MDPDAPCVPDDNPNAPEPVHHVKYWFPRDQIVVGCPPSHLRRAPDEANHGTPPAPHAYHTYRHRLLQIEGNCPLPTGNAKVDQFRDIADAVKGIGGIGGPFGPGGSPPVGPVAPTGTPGPFGDLSSIMSQMMGYRMQMLQFQLQMKLMQSLLSGLGD